MPNYEEVCWYCGSKKVFPIQTWFRCDDCGATYVPHSEIGSSPITLVDAETGGSPRPGRPTEYKVSGSLAKSASATRERKRREQKHDNGDKN